MTHAASGFSLENTPRHHFWLGGNKFVKVSSFTGFLRIHIRSYDFDGKLFHPTKYGVTMTPFTYKKLMDSILQLTDMDDVKIIDKKLLVCGSPSELGTVYKFQQLFCGQAGLFSLNPIGTSLNREQFEELSNIREEVWNSICEEIFGPIFKKSVLSSITSEQSSDYDYKELMDILSDTLGFAIHSHIFNVFDCKTCRLPLLEQPNNQLAHECSLFSIEEKWKLGFEEALACIDPKALGESFAKEVCNNEKLPKFLENFSVSELLEMTNERYINETC